MKNDPESTSLSNNEDPPEVSLWFQGYPDSGKGLG